jgi:hypothetical protein
MIWIKLADIGIAECEKAVMLIQNILAEVSNGVTI